MAERLAIAYGARSHFDGFTASSAGTHALAGKPIEPYAVSALKRLGGDDAARFEARQLTPSIAGDADLILTMTRAHLDDVLKVAPQQLRRTFTMREAAGLALECKARSVAELAAFRPQLTARGPSDIRDPIGKDEAFFTLVGTQMANLLPPVLELCRSGDRL
jgi:protein-tyrosine phosphatase